MEQSPVATGLLKDPASRVQHSHGEQHPERRNFHVEPGVDGVYPGPEQLGLGVQHVDRRLFPRIAQPLAGDQNLFGDDGRVSQEFDPLARRFQLFPGDALFFVDLATIILIGILGCRFFPRRGSYAGRGPKTGEHRPRRLQQDRPFAPNALYRSTSFSRLPSTTRSILG